jgi:hypothetical protein
VVLGRLKNRFVAVRRIHSRHRRLWLATLASMALAFGLGAVPNTCRRAQVATRLPVLCPARLPQATLAVRRGRGKQPPILRAEINGSTAQPAATGSGLIFGVEFSYGAPVEPASSPPGRPNWWRAADPSASSLPR